MSKIHEFVDRLKEGLTEHQKDCYGPVKWLVSTGARRSGRTYLMAVLAIEAAVSNPGYRVYLQDHFPGKRGDHYLINTIHSIIERADRARKPGQLRLMDMFKIYNDCSIMFGFQEDYSSAQVIDMDIIGGIFEIKKLNKWYLNYPLYNHFTFYIKGSWGQKEG